MAESWGSSARQKTARVLLLDDDAPLLRMLRGTFVANGFEVATATHGTEGLERIEKEGFDVIVLDLQMPVMDGRTFYRELRSRGVKTPVIILSAFGARAAQGELGAEGAVDKPFDPDTLVEVARRLAGR